MTPRPHASLVVFGDHQESCNVVLWNFTGEYSGHVVSCKRTKNALSCFNLFVRIFILCGSFYSSIEPEKKNKPQNV